MKAQELKEILESNLDNCTALIESNDDIHFNAVITSSSFDSINSKLKQQQLVYSIINDHILSGEIHAIAMKINKTK